MVIYQALRHLLLIGAPFCAHAATHSMGLQIVNANISPDGFERQTVLAGGTFPGPLITGNKGDNFEINVVNELHDLSMLKSTSIHWHGLFQHGTNWADGPQINQCPIAANHSFLYEFSVPDQAGTFWYHSHYQTQYCDGLRGPLVIYDPADPYHHLYDVDDAATVLTLGDWYHTPAPSITGIPIPDAALLNGKGRYPGGPDAELAVVDVLSSLRYRFRLISISCDSNHIFSIDNHTMNVIEVDGVNHNQLTVDSIQIYAAQRYSFVLTANQPINNYWIRFIPDNGNTTFINNMNMGILRYLGATLTNPTTPQMASAEPLVETNLVPLTNAKPPGEACAGCVDTAYNLVLGFNGADFTINDVSFVIPEVPVLLQIISGTTDAADLLPPGSIYPLPADSSIELSFQTSGVAGQPHPFHLHGHTFSVIRSAGSTEYNYVNPVQRDVVSTGFAGDNVTIRFQTDNAGPWFLHCHIDWHVQAGFAVVLVEDIGDVKVDNPVPQDWTQLCPIYDNLTVSQL